MCAGFLHHVIVFDYRKYLNLVKFGPVVDRLRHKLPNSWPQLPQHRVVAIEEFILEGNTAGEFNCTKHMTDAKKFIDDFNQTGC